MRYNALLPRLLVVEIGVRTKGETDENRREDGKGLSKLCF